MAFVYKIKNIPQKWRQFLTKVRKSDSNTKQKWLIIFSAASSLLVVALWIVYINAFIADNTPFKDTAPPVPAAEKSQPANDSFFSTFKRGLAVAYSDLKPALKNLADKVSQPFEILKNFISRPNNISIEAPELNGYLLTPN